MAVAFNFRAMVLLIISGMILSGAVNKESWGVEACPQYCLDVAYMTCPSSGNQQLPGRCNCCMAPKGCTLHLNTGGSVSC